MTETREYRRPARHPELDGEAEVDLGRAASAVAARWWLPLLGLVLGVVVGWLASAGGEQVYRATALVYLGQPYVGNARVDSLATTPGNVREIATSEAVIRKAAADAGLAPRELRGHVSVQPVTGGASRAQQALTNVSVTLSAPRRAAEAANSIAREVTNKVSGYAEGKIAAIEGQIAAADREVAALQQQVEAAQAALEQGGLSPTERLVVSSTIAQAELRRATVLQTKLDRQQQLELAREVERASIVEPAVPREVTARSRRNTLVVAGAIGLLLGFAAALAWDPVASRLGRRRLD